jgi:hypothetical protein
MLRKLAFITAAVVAVAGCDLDVPDLNNPGLDELEENPTPSGVSAAATGLLIGSRVGIAAANGYVSQLGILGRESYNFDNADPRYVQELLAGQLNPGSPFGGNFWTAPYRNIRDANIVLKAAEKVVEFSAEQKAAIKGFAQTIQALSLLVVINTHDANGAVLETDLPIEELSPIVTDVGQLLGFVADLLDNAATNLSAAGDAFPFPLSRGYARFDAPAPFLTFNRALRARVAVYQGDYQAALAALGESFLTEDAGALDLGVYHSFSTGGGDTTNALLNPNIFAHPSVGTDAEAGDNRFVRKVVKRPEPSTRLGLESDLQFLLYTSPSSPVPIIRNEELILLRAEANIGIGGANNIDAAIADINFIRVSSGLLAARTDLNADNVLDELLYNKRYSLLFEGGHRWIDLRRYGRLDELPLDIEGHIVNERYPIPLNEQNARK